MSENQADSSLISGESNENVSSENGVDKNGKKIRRNYCYVCKIQCTCPKNFEDHIKGRKHLKNEKALTRQICCFICKKQFHISNIEEHQKGKKHLRKLTLAQSANQHSSGNNTPTKGNVKSLSENAASLNNSSKHSKKNSNTFKITKHSNSVSDTSSNSKHSNSGNNKSFNTKHSNFGSNKFSNTEDSYSSSSKLSNIKNSNSVSDKSSTEMNHNQQYYQKNRRYDYNRDFENRYPRNQNSRYYNSRGFHHNNYYYGNERFGQRQSQPISPFIESPGTSYSQHYDSCFWNPNQPGLEYELTPRSNNSFINPFRAYAQNLQDVQVYGNNDDLNTRSTVAESSEVLQSVSSHLSTENIDNAGNKYTKNGNAFSSKKSNTKSEVHLEHGNDKGDGQSSKISEINITPRRAEKVRLVRSRSLSASETGNDKRKEDKSEDDANVESGAQEEKIKEWTNSLLETSNNQISRLVNPSNFKEKAAVNHLLTKFSKSKRKEILTRTLRSESMESIENDDEDMNSEVENSNLINEELCIILDTKEKKSDSELQSSPAMNKSEKNYHKSLDCRDKMSDSEQCYSLAMHKNEKNYSKSLDCRDKMSDSEQFYSLTMHKSEKNYSKSLDCRDKMSDSEQRYSLAMHKNEKNYSKSDNSKKQIKKKNSGNAVTPSPKRKSSKKSVYNNEKNEESSTQSSEITDSAKEKSSPNVHKEKSKKRKALGSDIGFKEKRRKSFSIEGVGRSGTNNIFELQDFEEDATPTENPPDSTKTSSQVSSTVPDSTPTLKKEIFSSPAADGNVPSDDTSHQNVQDQSFGFNSEFTVESFIQFFASGAVKVKTEFNDPMMEAIKDLNPDELIEACSNSKAINCADKTVLNPASKNKSIPETSSNLTSISRDSSIRPVILGSNVINDDISPVLSQSPSLTTTQKNTPSSPKSSSNKSKDQGSVSNIDTSPDDDLLNKSKQELPPQIKKLIKKLRDIDSKEGTVREELLETKLKINEYTALLEKMKKQEKELQDQEEGLRKQKNDIIKLMQDFIQVDSEEETISPSETPVTQTNNTSDTRRTKSEFEKKSTPVPSAGQGKDLLKPPSSDEIIILPVPCKPEPPEIVLDDCDENAQEKDSSNSREQGNGFTRNNINKGPTFYDLQNMNAHSTVINCLVVFEDFLYTCSNDSTAKRFSLKDPSQIVTYVHTAKNVTEIVVEKVQTEALVFTSCSTKVISLFIASSGTKIKTFFPPCAVMSICKGWGKFYSGFANGAVNVYNWKYEEIEIVKTETSASRLATADQGRIHVLVILSSEGNISIRDAETGLLIRYIKVYIKHPSLMTLHNDLVYLSSADKVLSILDLSSGRVEKRLHLNNHTTGLAVYDDYIFTICYSGIINCFNKDKSSDKKLYYGAGKSGLTCIYVYQDLVFTGNRKGEVSQFLFDPSSVSSCQFNKCDAIYGLREDLEYHVEKDHLLRKKNLTNCNWQGCRFIFPRNADTTDKMNHLKSHVYEMHFFV